MNEKASTTRKTNLLKFKLLEYSTFVIKLIFDKIKIPRAKMNYILV